MMYEGHWMGSGFGGGFMWIFLILLVVAVLWVFKASNDGRGGPRAEPTSALEILEQRYARGEIEREEYEQKRRDLEA